ncbi:MAG: hypothetical protein QOI12_4600 [Alphaproteobacteria bacterium]|jgi:hypothetical protein|nr:hypothetical protein [Alphaproteobacteria bacterium]
MKQLLKTAAIVAAACGLMAGIHGVAAHHSVTMFDQAKTLTIKGKVVELRWVNPHATVSVNGMVTETNEPATWLFEMTSPGNLTRVGGWTRTSVKTGDDVVVDFAPLRDSATKGGNLKKLVLVSTGQVFTSNIRDQERPGLE